MVNWKKIAQKQWVNHEIGSKDEAVLGIPLPPLENTTLPGGNGGSGQPPGVSPQERSRVQGSMIGHSQGVQNT